MPFDPDELADGMMRWIENGRKPKPAQDEPNPYDPGVIYQNPEPSPPPAEMPGSGPSIEELQEQIKALQEQLKEMEGDGGAQFIPHLKVPGPELTPDERRERDWEMHRKWMEGGDGKPEYLDDIDPGFYVRPRRPDDAFKYPQPVPMPTYPRNDRPYRPQPDDEDITAQMPSWGPYKNAPREQPRWGNLPYIREEDGRQEKPNFENLPYRYKEPMTESPYELLSSPVKGLNK